LNLRKKLTNADLAIETQEKLFDASTSNTPIESQKKLNFRDMAIESRGKLANGFKEGKFVNEIESREKLENSGNMRKNNMANKLKIEYKFQNQMNEESRNEYEVQNVLPQAFKIRTIG